MTVFHWACRISESEIAEMFMQKSTQFDIDLYAEDKSCTTAFQFASLNKNLIKAEIFMN